MSSIRPQVPDYELDDSFEVSTPSQLSAIAHPLRSTILDLVLERAATIGELATAVERPHGTVNYHVKVLVDAGVLRVVRTRRVRAIEERYYGRVARTLNIGVMRRPGDTTTPMCVNQLSVAASESVPAHEADTLYTSRRHARIPKERASEFWRRVDALIVDFSELPRGGETVYAFVAGLYPTDHPTLRPSDDESTDEGEDFSNGQ